MSHARADRRAATEIGFERGASGAIGTTTGPIRRTGRAAGWLAAAVASTLFAAVLVAPTPSTAVAAESVSLGSMGDLVQAVPTLVVTPPTATNLAVASIDNPVCKEGESCVFTVTINGTIAQSATLHWATVNGTAVGDVKTPPGLVADYHSDGRDTTFGHQTNQSVTMHIVIDTYRDGRAEGPETFQVVLSNPRGGIVIPAGQGTGTGTILANNS